MTYRLKIKKEEHYVSAFATGIRNRENISSMAQEILDACKQHQVDKVLIDVREMNGRLSIFDSLAIISKDFSKLKQFRILNKAVIVDAESRRERFSFFEQVARRRGYNIRVFDDVDEAIEWIGKDEPR